MCVRERGGVCVCEGEREGVRVCVFFSQIEDRKTRQILPILPILPILA